MVIALALLASAAAPFRLHFDNREFGQVVFNVTCLSGRIACTKPLIEKFWQAELRWNAEDQRQLNTWRSTLDAVAARQPGPEPAEFLPNYGGYFPELVAASRIIAAALESHSPPDFRRKAAGLAEPAELDTLAGALGHFKKRMHPWWKAKGAPYRARRGKAIEAAMRDPKFSALAATIARFMEADAGTRDFHIHLIARGHPEEERATATFLRNHVFLELTDPMQPETARSIVMHEMTHAFYDTAPRQRHQQLIASFAASAEPRAQSYYALLNEALATGVQLMLLRAANPSDKDTYRHDYIPRLGRASSLLLERALDDPKSTLFDGFVEPYLRAGAAEMKEGANTPKFALLSLSLAKVGEGDLQAADDAFHSGFAALGHASFEHRTRFPQMHLAMLVVYADLAGIASNWEDVPALAKEYRGFAFVAPRQGKGSVFVMAGRDGETVAEVVRKLAAATALPERGLAVSVQ